MKRWIRRGTALFMALWMLAAVPTAGTADDSAKAAEAAKGTSAAPVMGMDPMEGAAPDAVTNAAGASTGGAKAAEAAEGSDSAAVTDTNTNTETEAERFRRILLDSLSAFGEKGGYFTSKTPNRSFPHTAWEGLDAAVTIVDGKPVIRPELAKPSFCSGACYLALLNALSKWDEKGTISTEAWRCLKPYTVEGAAWPIQEDGVGCWGRANANGPGFAALLAQLKAGESVYIGNRASFATQKAWLEVWDGVEPGDFLKLFWNQYIGADASQKGKAESGHLVILLSREAAWAADGTRDDILTYWSSNGYGSQPAGGYGIGRCHLSDIRRVVAARVTDPAAFARAREIYPDVKDPWLSALDGRRLATVRELQASIRGEDMRLWL